MGFKNKKMIQENFLLTTFQEDFFNLKREHISLERIADVCGVTVNTVKNWADPTMGGIPSVTKARKLADLLGERLDDFEKKYIKIKITKP